MTEKPDNDKGGRKDWSPAVLLGLMVLGSILFIGGFSYMDYKMGKGWWNESSQRDKGKDKK
jgi:hypothetical protein